VSGHQQTRWDAKSINFLSRLTHDLMMPVKPVYRVQGTGYRVQGTGYRVHICACQCSIMKGAIDLGALQ